MDFEHLLVARDHGGDAAHINDALPNALDIQLFAAQQENDLVAKFFLDGHAPFFHMCLVWVQVRDGRTGARVAASSRIEIRSPRREYNARCPLK